MTPVFKKNFAVFPVLDWIATLAAHIPDKGEQLDRYYGYYCNVSREREKGKSPKRKPRFARSTRRRYPGIKKRWSTNLDLRSFGKAQDRFWISDYGTKTQLDVVGGLFSP